ncbi:MAG: histidinol phosphate phosphatase domain-containing protein [Anaerolineae bacterium]
MSNCIDVHVHSLLSDGSLLPTEVLRRLQCLGCAGMAFADHADASSIDRIVTALRQLVEEQGQDYAFPVLIGVELTHVAPLSIARLARRAKDSGADIVLVHGETLVEPVAPGTNMAAVTCPDVDVLAHPGLLTIEEAKEAAAHGVYLEISARKGNALGNGRVAALAVEAGARFVVNSDAHEPSDLIDVHMARRIALGAGLSPALAEAAVCEYPAELVRRALLRRKR